MHPNAPLMESQITSSCQNVIPPESALNRSKRLLLTRKCLNMTLFCLFLMLFNVKSGVFEPFLETVSENGAVGPDSQHVWKVNNRSFMSIMAHAQNCTLLRKGSHSRLISILQKWMIFRSYLTLLLTFSPGFVKSTLFPT